MPSQALPPLASPTSSDRVRQVVVTLAEVFCVIGTLVGVGLLGTRVEETAGGALSAEATRLAPAGPAFSIWSVIYLGLAAYTVWQWLPSQTTTPRARATGWLVAASMVLNAAWLLVTQQGWLWVSVVVILALVAVLGELVRRLTVTAAPAGGPARTVEAVVVDGTFGLYLGWVAVATCANVTAALIDSGVEPSAGVSDVAAVLVLLAVAGLGVFLAERLGGRYAVAGAAAWGLVWIAVGRTTSDPHSVATGVAAVTAAVVVVVATVLARARTARPDPA